MNTLGFRKTSLSSKKKKCSRCLKGKKLPNHRVYCQFVYGRKIVFLHDFKIYKGQDVSSDVDIRKVMYRDIFVR